MWPGSHVFRLFLYPGDASGISVAGQFLLQLFLVQGVELFNPQQADVISSLIFKRCL